MSPRIHHRWHNSYQSVIFLIAVQLTSSFKFQCPPPSHWNFRAASICNSSISKYVCLYDDNTHEYRERCEPKEDFQPPGFKDVILGGLQSKECHADRYQPIKFWTNGSSECIYEKSFCEEEGQVTYNDGTTTTDRICRCDYTKGYAYVSTPDNPCFCVPSKEDCSCFYKHCDVGLVLGPDYECFDVKTWSGDFKCPDITQSRSVDPPTETKVSTDSKHEPKVSTSSTILIPVILLFMLLFFLVVTTVTYYLHKKGRKGKENVRQDEEEGGNKSHQDDIIDQWEEEDKTFVMTETVLSILNNLEKKNSVLITGLTGIGKSVILRHIALVYKNIHSYSIVICDNPSEFETLYLRDTKQIIVIDDICGKYTVNKNEMHIWEQNKTMITRLLLKGNVKIIASCSDQIYTDKMFRRSLSLTKNAFDLTSSKFSLSPEKRTEIARRYLPDRIIHKIALDSHKYPFLPLLCSLARHMPEEEAVDLFNDPVTHYTKEVDSFLQSGKHDKFKCLALFVLVVYNGRLSQALFSEDDNEHKFSNFVNNLCQVFGIHQNTHIRHNIKRELNNLVGKYLTKDGFSFIALHETIFDILCKYFGNKFQKETIMNANINIIRERTQLRSIHEESYQFTIMIDKENEEIYFRRILTKPNIEDIMCNNQMKFPGYRLKLIDYIKRHIAEEKSLKILLTLASNGKKSPLHIACTEGYTELVEYILEFKEDLNADGSPYVFEACLHGHDKIAQLLIEKGADINQASTSGMTPLMIACKNRNKDLINYLIGKKADMYKPSNNGLSPLTAVCKDGDQKIFTLLLAKASI